MDSADPSGAPQRAVQFEHLFPDVDAVAVFLTSSLLHDAPLSAEEATFIERAVDGRKAEFATGRACARAALAAVGFDAPSLPVGEGRQPIWPIGATAAITHTRRRGRQFVAAAAASSDEGALAIGVDAEVIQPLRDGVRELLLVPEELEMVETLPADQREEAAIRIFSAKEAFYKAQFALTGGWVGFGDMKVDRIADEGLLLQTGELEVLKAVVTPVQFHQTIHDGLVISGVTVTRR